MRAAVLYQEQAHTDAGEMRYPPVVKLPNPQQDAPSSEARYQGRLLLMNNRCLRVTLTNPCSFGQAWRFLAAMAWRASLQHSDSDVAIFRVRCQLQSVAVHWQPTGSPIDTSLAAGREAFLQAMCTAITCSPVASISVTCITVYMSTAAYSR
jgi:hypothetical protein